jgi:Zn-dependent alcohol dehydrogenase
MDGIDLLHGQKRVLSSLGGNCSPERDFPTFVQWYASGEFKLDKLVTDRYSLDQVNEAVADLRAGRVRGRAVLMF